MLFAALTDLHIKHSNEGCRCMSGLGSEVQKKCTALITRAASSRNVSIVNSRAVGFDANEVAMLGQ